LNLRSDILILLAQQDLRPSEIREKLLPEYERKHHYSKRSFDVLIIRELSKLGKFVKRKDKGHQLVLYTINKRGLEELERIKVKNLTDSIDAKWLESLRRLLIRVKNEGTDPRDFLQGNCIAFIGSVPCTFPKSVRGLQGHIARENNLRRRHRHELEPLLEKYMQIRQKYGKGSKESLDFFERIREEVGLTIEEYLEKLLQKVDKEKGIRKIMTFFGITEEMVEEMYGKRD